MARTLYPDDLDRAPFEAEQTATYAREDELYGLYQEGKGEAVTCVAIALEDKRTLHESLHHQPPSRTYTEIQAADARLAEARAQLQESQEALHVLGAQPVDGIYLDDDEAMRVTDEQRQCSHRSRASTRAPMAMRFWRWRIKRAPKRST
jgi:hypothetical protein